MKINKGYKYSINPTDEQKELINKTIGSCRFVYNYILGKSIDYYKENTKSMKLSIEKSMKEEFEWLKEVDSIAIQQSRMNLDRAFKDFFSKKCKFPTFKSKRKSRKSYKTINQRDSVRLENGYVKLPKLGFVKINLHRELPKDSRICSATISEKNGKYYVSLLVEYERDIIPIKATKFLGLDYSQPNFYVDSENRKPNFPKPKRNLQNKLSKEQRKLSRMVKGSNNYNKQKLKISKIEEHIANQRKDWLHKKSFELVNEWDAICVEDIDLRAMSQCLSLGKNISDNGFGMFRTMLEYKLKDRGKYFIKIDRFYPSSKLCRHCGQVNKDLKVGIFEWVCDCGETIDRDYNASLNIKEEGFRLYAEGTSV